MGQEHLVGHGKPIAEAVRKKHLFSFIFWGPPGVGKTTLARIYAKNLNAELYELSAVSAGKEDVRRIVEGGGDGWIARLTASPELQRGEPARQDKKARILFLDEIHRFNKAQQDFLLPYVESGKLTLIGATTENPSFEVISALLSRCRVFVMNELKPGEIKKIISRTGLKIDGEAENWLVAMANGDARQAINVIEAANNLYGKVTLKTLKDVLQSKHLRYDKKGEEHYNTISAFIKSLRAGDQNAALYYLARMIDAGEDPKFIVRRMVIFASEDIGLAQPAAIVVANEIFRAVETIGLPECAINLAHGAVYLAQCKKDRRAYDGLMAATEDVKKHGNLPIPLKIRNAPTKLMKNLGYGKGYQKYDKEDLLPEKLKDRKYFKDMPPGSG